MENSCTGMWDEIITFDRAFLTDRNSLLYRLYANRLTLPRNRFRNILCRKAVISTLPKALFFYHRCI
jgi:hypothetical protein